MHQRWPPRQSIHSDALPTFCTTFFFLSLVNQVIVSKTFIECVMPENIYRVTPSSHFIAYSFLILFLLLFLYFFFLQSLFSNFLIFLLILVLIFFFSFYFMDVKFSLKICFCPCFVPLGKKHSSTGKVGNIHQF